jgi:phosphatidate cytidylyltransferase
MLKTRVITAIFLVIGFLTTLYLASDLTWSLLSLSVTLIGLWEWSKLISLNTWQMRIMLSVALTIGLLLTFNPSLTISPLYDVVKLLLLALAALFWLVIAPLFLWSGRKINQKWLMATLGLFLLLATWLALVGLHRISPWVLLSVMATVWIADSAAYFAGKRFGRNKLAPSISPGKTWEGVVGAMLAVSAYGYALCYHFNLSAWLIVGMALLVLFSVMGDLFESLLKRQAGVKDSSQLLPGHGGVLDRIDGLIPTLVLTFFVYVFSPFCEVISTCLTL